MSSLEFSDITIRITKQLSKTEKKEQGIFITPQTIIHKLWEHLEPILGWNSETKYYILEPSAGTGEIIRYLENRITNNVIDAVEKNNLLFESLNSCNVKQNEFHNEWEKNKNSPNIIRFFHIFYENSKNIPEITSSNSIESYLKDFLEQNKMNVKRIIEEVSKRQTGKRFIFFDKHNKQWYLGYFDDEFEFKSEEKESRKEESILLHKTKLSIATKKGNYLQFNLRWANGKGIQNPVWQINPVTKSGKKLPFIILRQDDNKEEIVQEEL